MSKDLIRELQIAAGKLNGLVRQLPQLAGAVVLESIDDNFRAQGFFGQAWAPRKLQKGNEGRAILVQSGRLKRSFKLDARGLTLVIHTDAPYAQIHNEGGTISGTANVKAYTRHQYEVNEVSKPGARKEKYKREKVGSHQVGAHSRNVNLKIPQRQFMGEHPELDKKIEALITRGLDSIFA